MKSAPAKHIMAIDSGNLNLIRVQGLFLTIGFIYGSSQKCAVCCQTEEGQKSFPFLKQSVIGIYIVLLEQTVGSGSTMSAFSAFSAEISDCMVEKNTPGISLSNVSISSFLNSSLCRMQFCGLLSCSKYSL